jgi:hypothetical protein
MARAAAHETESTPTRWQHQRLRSTSGIAEERGLLFEDYSAFAFPN